MRMIQWITSSQVQWSVLMRALLGCRSQTKMAVGRTLAIHCTARGLRYSRADSPLRKWVRLEIHMQIIHRSVGEPAEGSLTRIHVSTQSERVFILPHGQWTNRVDREVRVELARANSLFTNWGSQGPRRLHYCWGYFLYYWGSQLCHGSKEQLFT